MNKKFLSLLVLLILALGLAVRLYDVTQPLLEFHPTRQLFSAIKARGMFYEGRSNAPAWQQDLAVRQYEGEATIEPPLMEHLAVWTYQFTGEAPWVMRIYSSIFWLLGGIFLFLLARRLFSTAGAVTALVAFVLLPYAVESSRVFQPDPLMVALIVAFLWAVERWSRTLAWRWMLAAALLGGAAIFVKSLAVFFIAGGALGALWAWTGFRRALRSPQTWALMLLGALPGAAYTYYGLYIGHFLGQQFNNRFYPELWVQPFFYIRWFAKVDLVIGVVVLSLALFGWLLLSERGARRFLSVLWLAYLLFGFAFAHHISTHDYYSMPLIPIVALSLAPLADVVFPRVQAMLDTSRLGRVLAVAALFFSLGSLPLKVTLDLHSVDYRGQAAFWAQVGGVLEHQASIIALTTDYGYPLEYYGWQNAALWPLSGDIGNFSHVFSSLTRNKSYFLITDFDEYNRQPDLQKRLSQNYPVFAQGNGYIIYDLLHPLKKAK